MTIEDRLNEIKELHDKANKLVVSNKHDNIEEVEKIIIGLFMDEHTDWLIDQAKELSNIKRLLNDMRRLERNGQLFIDGEAYSIQYNRSVDELE